MDRREADGGDAELAGGGDKNAGRGQREGSSAGRLLRQDRRCSHVACTHARGEANRCASSHAPIMGA